MLPFPVSAKRLSFLDRTEAFFRAFPNQWLEASRFERVGGRQAWRTRIAECRTKRGMVIENRTWRTTSGVVVSEYRYVPKAVEA